jgi:hypothetical protein
MPDSAGVWSAGCSVLSSCDESVTVLGNPDIRPWDELKELAGEIRYEEFQWGTYYICRGQKREA